MQTPRYPEAGSVPIGVNFDGAITELPIDSSRCAPPSASEWMGRTRRVARLGIVSMLATLVCGCARRPDECWMTAVGQHPPIEPTFAASEGGHFLAIHQDGQLWGWGANGQGEVEASATHDLATPVPVQSGQRWRTVAVAPGVSMGIRADGSLWVWGQPWSLPVPDAQARRPGPVDLGAGTIWTHCSAGTRWLAGLSDQGQLRIWDRQSPDGRATNLPAAEGWRYGAVGPLGVVGIRRDGSLWLWGERLSQRQRVHFETGKPVRQREEVREPYFARLGNTEGWIFASLEESGLVGIRENGDLCFYGLSPRLAFEDLKSGELPFRLHALRAWTNGLGWRSAGLFKPKFRAPGIWALDGNGRLWLGGPESRGFFRLLGILTPDNLDETEVGRVPAVTEAWSHLAATGSGSGMIQRADGKLGWWSEARWQPPRPAWLPRLPDGWLTEDPPKPSTVLRVAETRPAYAHWRNQLLGWVLGGCLIGGALLIAGGPGLTGVLIAKSGRQTAVADRVRNPFRYWAWVGTLWLSLAQVLLFAVIVIGLAGTISRQSFPIRLSWTTRFAEGIAPWGAWVLMIIAVAMLILWLRRLWIQVRFFASRPGLEVPGHLRSHDPLRFWLGVLGRLTVFVGAVLTMACLVW